MESGVAPPPTRRSTPKSLVGTRDPRRQSETSTTNSVHPAPQTQQPRDELSLREQRLEDMLQAEASENRRLQAALREQTVKFERSLGHQNQLEEDVVSRDAQINLLNDELRILKQKKHSSDSELAQSAADYMNCQAKWLEQVDQLNDEINLLKVKLSESKIISSGLEKEVTEFREKERQRELEERKKAKTATPDQNIQVAADSLEKHQTDLLINELRSRHSQITAEIAEIKAVNERLREDNESFQYLLVERTVSGNLGAPGVDPNGATANGKMGGQTLADEDVFEFDSAGGGEPRKDTNSGSTYLAYEANDEHSSSMTPTSEVSESGEDSDVKFLQKTINKQHFELQSLHNHNRALKLSLERLVDRLLDNKTFSRAVEDAVSTNIVQRFRQRLASSTKELDRRIGANGEHSGEGSNMSRTNSSQMPASVWSNMIFNTQYSGTPNRRVVSLGVDSEYKAAPPPIIPHYTGNTVRTVSTSGSVDGARPLGRVKEQFRKHSGGSSPSLHSLDSPPSSIQVAKRTDSQSGLRKLQLKE